MVSRPLIIAFANAVVISGVLYTIYVLSTEHSGLHGVSYALVVLFFALTFSVSTTIVLAVPAFLVLIRLNLLSRSITILAGLVIGAIAAGITEWPQSGFAAFLDSELNDHAVSRTYACSAIGVVSGICFWETWKRLTRRESDFLL
jgi:O-antigen ligase